MTTLPPDMVARLGAKLRQALDSYDDRLAEGGDPEDFRYAVYERAREEVVEALDRIESGRYGQCKVCDRPIPVERLEALPHSIACASCADRYNDA